MRMTSILLIIGVSAAVGFGFGLPSNPEPDRGLSQQAEIDRIIIEIEPFINKSDDWRTFGGSFKQVAAEMIYEGVCLKSDIEENGGFWRSTKWKDSYFIYCPKGGQIHASNKYYFNVKTEKVFQ